MDADWNEDKHEDKNKGDPEREIDPGTSLRISRNREFSADHWQVRNREEDKNLTRGILLNPEGSHGIHPSRIRFSHTNPVQRGPHVLLWLQVSVRSSCNHTLEYAIEQANEFRKPVIACFALTPSYPEANERHYAFLLEGLADVGKALRERGIPSLFKRETHPV